MYSIGIAKSSGALHASKLASHTHMWLVSAYGWLTVDSEMRIQTLTAQFHVICMMCFCTADFLASLSLLAVHLGGLQAGQALDQRAVQAMQPSVHAEPSARGIRVWARHRAALEEEAPDGAASSRATEAPDSACDSCKEAQPGLSQELCEARAWVRIYLNNPHPNFKQLFVQFLIGKHGTNMKRMCAKTKGQAKYRIRGIGSGHLEVNGDREAPVPLQLMVSVPKSYSDMLCLALQLATDLLLRSVRFFKQWILQNRIHPAEISVEPMFFIGDVSVGAKLLIKDLWQEFGIPGEARAKNHAIAPSRIGGGAPSQPKQFSEAAAFAPLLAFSSSGAAVWGPLTLSSDDGYMAWHWDWFHHGWWGQWVQNCPDPDAGWWQLQQQAPGTAGTIALDGRDEPVAVCSSIRGSWCKSAMYEPAQPQQLCKVSATQPCRCDSEFFSAIEKRILQVLNRTGNPDASSVNLGGGA